jgi:hypothetical protein
MMRPLTAGQLCNGAKDTMKQIAQNYKSGVLAVLEAPAPACRPGRRIRAVTVLAHFRHRV